MKRLFTVILSFIALTLLGTALAGTTSSVPAGSYRSTQYGYRLTFPSGWYYIQSEPGTKMSFEADMFCNSPDLADGSVWVEINFVPEGAALTDKSVVDVTRGEEDEDKFSVAKDAMVPHGGGQARALEGNTMSDGDPMYYYALAVPAKARHTVLVAEIFGPPEVMQRPDMQKQVRAMLDSFQATD
jgi:hypothetical protein